MYLSLSSSGPVQWNPNQESSLLQDVSPFSPAYDGRSTVTLNERIRELYLQFLWLPESVMPLNQFVNMVQPLLARHSATTPMPDDDDVHPLHAALDDILLTGKWCCYKYQEQLPNFISHLPCQDLEASIMLFVLERHALLRPGPSKGEHVQNSLDDKKRWLSEIEKREVKIQILLHLLKLSLPGECPSVPVRPIPVPSHAHKRRRVQPSSDDEEENTHRRILEDRLEGLMDKLVLWQLALTDAEIGADGTKPVSDWTQIFCDDVVQPAFAQILPDQYKLLRRRLFRIPQWTSDSDPGPDSDADNNDNKPVQGTTDRLTGKPLLDNNPHANTVHGTVQQSRSRSLSVSLEQEAGLRRTESKPRRVLQREVSMSKVFKGRRNDGPNIPPVKVESEAVASSSTTTTTTTTQAHPVPMKGPIVLVEGTPQKPKAKESKSARAHR